MLAQLYGSEGFRNNTYNRMGLLPEDLHELPASALVKLIAKLHIADRLLDIAKEQGINIEDSAELKKISIATDAWNKKVDAQMSMGFFGNVMLLAIVMSLIYIFMR